MNEDSRISSQQVNGRGWAHARRGKAASSIDTGEDELARSSAGLALILG